MNDLRSHVVPGVDDGSASLEGSFAALACMGEQGVRPLVVTPRVGDSLRPRPEALAPPSLEPPPPLGALRRSLWSRLVLPGSRRARRAGRRDG